MAANDPHMSSIDSIESTATTALKAIDAISDAIFEALDEDLEDLRLTAIRSRGHIWEQSLVALKCGYVAGRLATMMQLDVIDVDTFIELGDISRAWMVYGMETKV